MSDVISLLQDLVRIPSVNPSTAGPREPSGEGRVADFLEAWLQAAGLRTLRQPTPLAGRDNLLAVYPGAGGPALMLEAHLDTMSGAGMRGEPFSGELAEGRVWGRGACDCKGALAGMLAAVRRAGQERLPTPCLLAALVDEEAFFTGIRTFLRQRPPVPVRAAVVGEPTRLEVIDRHGGAVRLNFVIHGRAAHSAYPELGDNAILHAAELVQALAAHHRDLQLEGNPALGVRTCTPTLIHGGSAINVIPERCTVGVDRRLRPGERPETVREELEQVVTWAAGARFAWETEIILLDPPLTPRVPSPLADLGERAVREVRGAAQRSAVTYSTDASNLAESGTEAIVLGPGDIAQAHSAEEWVEVEQVEQAAEIYYRILEGAGEL
jgi:acetylornithine deacetylase